MTLSFLYRAFYRVLQLVRLTCRSDTELANEVVITKWQSFVVRSTDRYCSPLTGRC